MQLFQIKICGITETADAIDAIRSGADAIGLNFYSKSRRSVDSVAAAKQIIVGLRNFAKSEKRTLPTIVGVFVNHTVQEICDIDKGLDLDAIQLHGDEPIDFLGRLKKSLQSTANRPAGPCFIRALRTRPYGDAADDQSLANSRQTVAREILEWNEAKIDGVLLDAAATGEFGGTGKSIDWSIVAELQQVSTAPIVLAGGLKPENVRQAIQISGVLAVDTASGVEVTAGKKSTQLVQQFCRAAHQAFERQADV